MRGTSVVWCLVAAACAPIGATPTNPSLTGTTPTPPPPVSSPTVPTAGVVEDRILQDVHNKVDVLYVVQDTAGMADLQDALAENSPYFWEYHLGSGIDYHVGVVTTDLDDPARSGKLLEAGGLKWVDADTPSPVEIFGLMATAGEAGATPQPLGAVYAALETERALANAGFWRDDAALEVIVVGDGADATDPANLDPAGFEAWFDALKADPEDASLSCLVLDGSPATACADTSAAVGGTVHGSADLPQALEHLGSDTVGFVQEYALSANPDPTTIELMIDDVTGAQLQFWEAVPDAAGVLQGDWTYDPVANAVILLEYVPNNGAEVVITYVAVP